MSILHPFDPQTWPFQITDLPPGGYLVGGAVRDGLHHRCRDYWDLDIILPGDVLSLAHQLAQKYRTGFVVLDVERQIARLIFPKVTLDLSQMQGGDITSDLSQRDFTINAMAWDYQTHALYDPHQGQKDLQTQRIRMVHSDNLRHDPLRLLRAYRLAAQLEFEIEWTTRQTIKNLASLLKNTAPERVQSEVNLLLDCHGFAPHLLTAWQDGILTPWFPDIKTHWMKLLPRWESLLPSYPKLAPLLQPELRQGRSVLNVLKLRCLLPENCQIAQQTLTQLRYSRAEIQYLEKLITLWPVFQPLLSASVLPIPSQFDLFQRAGSVLPGLVATALVHNYPWPVLAPWFDRFTNPQDPVAHALPLVTGHDLMATLHLTPSPQVGQLLHSLALAHAQGQITTPAQAIAWAANLLATRPAERN